MNQILEFIKRLFYKPHSVPVAGYQPWVDVAHVSMCFLIVLLHTASPLLYSYTARSLNCQLANLFSLARFAIPVFIMVSGYLYLTLKKDKPLSYIFSKSAHFWLLLYVWNMILGSFSDVTWFLNMLAILLMLAPLFRLVIKHKIWEEIFLICGVISFVLFQTFSHVYSPHMFEFYPLYGFYFVAGHYLVVYPPRVITRRVMYVLGIIFAGLAVFLTGYMAFQKGAMLRSYDDYISIFYVFPSVGIFLFIKTNASRLNVQTLSYFTRLAPYTLGIYLLHIPILWGVLEQSLNNAPITILLWVPWMALFAFFTCAFLTWLLMKIPLVRYFMR